MPGEDRDGDVPLQTPKLRRDGEKDRVVPGVSHAVGPADHDAPALPRGKLLRLHNGTSCDCRKKGVNYNTSIIIPYFEGQEQADL